jgi:benzoyl-CoA reductase/2-hydroxyglutaryl-CoA dehydratase subunit BcrC/BadD/HgdB
MLDAALGGVPGDAYVMTTACDQMRYAAAVVHERGRPPVFLFHLPATWQTSAARQLYSEELGRLGRFLEQLGGRAPFADELARIMREYDAARRAFRKARPRLSGRQCARALADLRGLPGPPGIRAGRAPGGGVPLAVLGGPWLEADGAIFDFIEQAGGRVVLDATEAGERTLPPPFDFWRTEHRPLEELVDAYFGSIPDVFRRPNSALYEWLPRQLAARDARGIVVRRYVWCDLWHAELPRLKECCRLPVLDLDAALDDAGAAARVQGQIEAFLELLR